MSEQYNLPNEVIKFFQEKKGNSLLLKGAPGTGKTIFALTLLGKITEKKNGIYVTTRINKKHLLTHFPVINKIMDVDNIVEATKTKFPDKNNKADIVGLDYVTMSEFLLSMLDRITGIEEPILVIDSWDAVIAKLDENRSESEHDLIDFASKTDIRLILIAEYEDNRELDYFVDGIIKLRMNSVQARTQREMIMEKLRGVAIKQPTYLFTLDKGMFRSFKPFRLRIPVKQCSIEPIPDPSEDYISTGIEEFDKLLQGGYRKGSFNLFELKHGVEAKDVLMIAPTIINRVNQKRHVFIFSTESIEEQVIENIIQSLSQDSVEDYVKIQSEVLEGVEVPEYVFPAKGESIDEDMAPLLKLRSDNLKEETTMSILGFDRLEHIYGSKELKRMIWKYLKYFQSNRQVDIGIVNEDQTEIKNLLGPMANTHLKVKLHYNTVLTYGIVPHTGFYVVEQDPSKNNCLSASLIPVV